MNHLNALLHALLDLQEPARDLTAEDGDARAPQRQGLTGLVRARAGICFSTVDWAETETRPDRTGLKPG